ncbi:MAG TPA: chemotaxis protein CheW [Pyrinomonadaceae bacterium]|jgi:chemotaxis signal transduction protein|nr:chemotaxis protein CheW [Pyrinomonadaceae bacterium]
MNNETSDSQPWFGEASSKDEHCTLQLVRAGAVQFGLLADGIAAIVPWLEPAPLPQAPKSVLGVVSIQGRMLTVLELAALAGSEAISSAAPVDSARRIIALRGDEQLALAVDAVGEIVTISTQDLKPGLDERALILGTLQLEGSEINVLNLRDLFPAAIRGRERRRRRF